MVYGNGWNEIIKIFIAGLTLGWGPCLAFCIPILFPYFSILGTNWKSGLKLAIFFSISKLIICSILGLLAVVAFRLVSKVVGEWAYFFKLIMGVFVVLIGISFWVGKINFYPCKYLHTFFTKKSNLNMIILGILIGLSPCPPLVGILTYIAAMAENVFYGWVYGLSFGLGTFFSPIILAGVFGGWFSSHIKEKAKFFNLTKVICCLILVYFGLSLILR